MADKFVDEADIKQKLYMYHYFSDSPIEISLESFEKRNHYFKFTSVPDNFELKYGDPLLILKIRGQHINVVGGTVFKLPTQEGVFLVRTDPADTSLDTRNYRRYPASIMVWVKERETKKRYECIVKDISSYGMKIYSNADINVDASLEISMSTGMTMYFIDSVVKNVMVNETYFEYGLLVPANDVQSTRDIRQFLKIYQQNCIKKIDPDILENTLDVEYIFEVDESSSMTKKLDSAAAKLDIMIKRNKN